MDLRIKGDQCSDDKHTHPTCKITVSGITSHIVQCPYEKNDLAYLFSVTDHSEEAAVEEAGVEEAAAEVPVEEAAVEEAAVEETPAEETPAEETGRNTVYNLAYLFNVTDHSEVEAAVEEAGVEEADVAEVEEAAAGVAVEEAATEETAVGSRRDLLHWPGSVEPYQPSGPVGGISKHIHRA